MGGEWGRLVGWVGVVGFYGGGGEVESVVGSGLEGKGLRLRVAGEDVLKSKQCRS